MEKRLPGRPVSATPKDTRVGIRLTDGELDQIYRFKKDDQTLSHWIRDAINRRLGELTSFYPGIANRDNPTALIERHKRKARSVNQDEVSSELESIFASDLGDSGEELTPKEAAAKGFEAAARIARALEEQTKPKVSVAQRRH